MPPFVVAFMVAAWRRPLPVLLPVYAGAVPFGSALAPGVGTRLASYLSLSSLLALGLIVLVPLRRHGNANPVRRLPPAVAAGALFLPLVAPTTLWPGTPTPVRRLPRAVAVWTFSLAVIATTTLWSVAPRLTLSAVAALAVTILLFAILATADVDASTLRRMENGILVGAALVCLYALGQFLTGHLPVRPPGGARAGQDLIGADHLAAALMLPLAIAAWRVGRASRWRDRAVYGATVVVVIVGMLLTGSRAGLIATLTIVVALAICSDRRKSMVALTLVVIGLVGAVLITQPGGVGARQTQTTSSGRTDIWRVGLHVCPHYCVIGAGWGTYGQVFEQSIVQTPGTKLLREVAYQPHNNWLLATVEAGALGILLILLGFGLAWRDALLTPPPWRGPPGAAGGGALCGRPLPLELRV